MRCFLQGGTLYVHFDRAVARVRVHILFFRDDQNTRSEDFPPFKMSGDTVVYFSQHFGLCASLLRARLLRGFCARASARLLRGSHESHSVVLRPSETSPTRF